MTSLITPSFLRMPSQSLGMNWQLAGSLKPIKHTPGGGGELILLRKIDALSPHIQAAQTSQYLIPQVTVTTPSGQTVQLYNVRVSGKTDTDDWTTKGGSSTATDEWERIDFVFRKIEVTHTGGKTFVDDWTL